MPGRTLGVATSGSCAEVVTIMYTASSVTQAVAIPPYPCIVTSISGRQRVNGGSGAQATFYKCESGQAAASGKILHSGIFDASSAGTADANQNLTLVSDQNTLTFDGAEDSLNIVWGGTLTSAVGFVQVVFEPLS